MKIIRKPEDKTPAQQTITIRVDMKVMDKLEEIRREQGISRQKLIEAILAKAVADPKFTIEV